MFEIRNVSKQYNGEFALNSVSLNLHKGMSFIVGASGSGKTTLLKIISGMEQAFDGEVFYCGKSIKSLSQKEKGYFYNNVFGFVWQDFNLLEDSTVLENVLLPEYLKSNQKTRLADKALKELKIYDIAEKKVRYLSGGQKQRVAIARELMKNPQVIIADEPTSALDGQNSRTTMDILRALSKNKTVIVVTHDTSLVAESDYVYELDKGELVSKPKITTSKAASIKMDHAQRLSLKNALSLAQINMKNKLGRFIISALSLVIASVLLLTTISGAINNSGQGEFDKLIETYGESLLDISIIDSFTDASGTGGDEKKKPDGTVSQNIGGLYDQYLKDDRVAFITYLQSFNDIHITLDNKKYQIQISGNSPVMNQMVAGEMPAGETNEVAVPESFLTNTGVSKEQIIGKEIEFTGAIYDWSTGEPILKPVSCKAKIVGVIDTTAIYEYEGKINHFTVDDAFFFSKSAILDMTNQAGTDMENADFLIRTRTPEDFIAIKDELNEEGIVPLGRFELVEDMVRLNNQTVEQSGSASAVIAMLSLVMVAAVFLITGLLRKKEYAIYKVSGFTTVHLFILNLAETLLAAVAAIFFMCVASPLLNIVTKELFDLDILNAKMLFAGGIMILITSGIAYFVTTLTFAGVNVSTALKSGDR